LSSQPKRSAGIALGVIAGLGWLVGCSDNLSGPCTSCTTTLPTGVIVSNPVPSAALASNSQAGMARAGSGASDVVYVSLDPGTAPGGTRAIVRRAGDATSVNPVVVDGGFDPVAIVAQAGDSIDVVVTDPGGAVVYQARAAVVAIRPPVIVRTDPPPKKRDVPLNASIVIVFSEPIDSTTLTPASVRLLRGGTAVAGSVHVLDVAQVKAAFVPDAPLAAQTDYQLVVSQTVRDRDGQALVAAETVPFTTGSSLTGPPAFISFSVDSGMALLPGATFQMTATVRDAAGNELTNQPIAWFTTDSSVLTVSATGLLTAVGDGYAYVGANAGVASNQTSVRVSALAAKSVSVSPGTTAVGAGDTVMLTATVRDSTGRIINHPSVTWSSSASGVATVATASLDPRIATVTGLSPGSVTITASISTGSASADLTVGPPVPVSAVTVAPASARLVVQGTVQLAATLRDASGKVLFPRATAWTSDNAALAMVDTNGLVTASGVGSATVTATSEGVSGTAAISVTTIVFQSLSANYSNTCGLTTGGAAYCWGDNYFGQLGNRSTTSSSVPVPVTGGLSFTLVTVGQAFACGLTSGGTAYCWGSNAGGALGDGSTTDRSVPVQVSGGLKFTSLSGGLAHTCGLTTSGAAYCWGSTTGSSVPVPVTGGLSFTLLTTGDQSTCGLIASGAAYCWGGSGSLPMPVPGGLSFTTLSTQFGTVCGVTANGAAYCWGDNSFGEIGDGSLTNRSVPVPVIGGLSFSTVSPGGYHVCGLPPSGAAYCWGRDVDGELGDGLNSDVSFPVPVAGGLSFTMVRSGGYHACGISTAGVAYCWGNNYFGQLGDGSTTSMNAPVKVAGQP
jgi:alpha-tubulin suppressor-like RCC1 family protein